MDKHSLADFEGACAPAEEEWAPDVSVWEAELERLRAEPAPVGQLQRHAELIERGCFLVNGDWRKAPSWDPLAMAIPLWDALPDLPDPAKPHPPVATRVRDSLATAPLSGALAVQWSVAAASIGLLSPEHLLSPAVLLAQLTISLALVTLTAIARTLTAIARTKRTAKTTPDHRCDRCRLPLVSEASRARGVCADCASIRNGGSNEWKLAG